MPRNNDLLKQAIADAKTIRETALANARLTLEEAFKPHFSKMVADELRNKAGLNENSDHSSEIGSGEVTVKNPGPKQPAKAASSSSDIPGHEHPSADEEIQPMGEGFEPGNFDDTEGDEDAHDVHGDGYGDDNGGEDLHSLKGEPLSADPHTAGQGAGEGDISEPTMGRPEDELDLEAIIRELEADTMEDESSGYNVSASVAPTHMGEGFDNAQAGAHVDGAIAPNGKASRNENTALNPGESKGPNYGKEVKPGQKETEGYNGKGKDHPDAESKDGVPGGKEVKPGDSVNEEFDLDEILREMEAEDEAPVSESTIVAENVELKSALREHREVIQFLRTKLHEVNTLNAKLLYTNKLFKNYNLNLEQKMRVVETFDRANTLREVKLVYSTLAESFSGKGKTASKRSVAQITEGMASKPVGSTRPKSQQILSEGDLQVARWQKIAGIRKS